MNPVLRRALAFCTFGRIVVTPGARDGRCYLTFDDGPHPRHTRPLLDLLERHRARATFFLVGKHILAAPDLAREIVLRGHGLGNHSFNHRGFWQLPLAEQMAEIEATERLLEDLDGMSAHPFRPPQGRLTAPLTAALIRRGTRIVLWTRDSEDYRLESPAVVARLGAQPLRTGDVVLFHDDGPQALGALEKLLPGWAAAGLRFDVMPLVSV